MSELSLMNCQAAADDFYLRFRAQAMRRRCRARANRNGPGAVV
jgi:hypothetical protein